MKLTHLNLPIMMICEYHEIQKIKRILLEDKQFLKLLNEAFSQLFFDKYPEFNQEIVTEIIAHLQRLIDTELKHDDRLLRMPRSSELDPIDVKVAIKGVLKKHGVDIKRAAELSNDEYIIKNFMRGFHDRPEWASIQKRLRPEPTLSGPPLKYRRLGLSQDPFADIPK